MQRQVVFAVAVATVVAGPAWAARDMCKMLRDKGVLNDVEYNECIAAQEKEEVRGESKTKEFLTTQLPAWLSKFTPLGDVRMRQEGFYENGANARNRERLRARFGFTFAPMDEVSSTVRLATGNSNDPISTNQSFENTFTGKPIHLDWAYLAVKPGKTFNLRPGMISIMGGKLPVTTYKVSELVWDDDLSPEGATETFTFVEQKEGFWRTVRLTGLQWVVDEISNDQDPWIGGAQLAADMAIGSTATWSAAVADYHYSNMDSVAAKFFNRYTDPPANTKSNSSYNGQLANGNDVTNNANGLITGYKYNFNILNATSELNFANPFGIGVPAGVFGDLAYNTQAAKRNLGFYVGAGIGKAGKGWYSNSMKNQGDWGASYTFARVEKDAVVSIFTYSDMQYGQAKVTQSGSTNVIANIVRFDYMLFPNFQLTAKAHAINALDTSESNAALSGSPTLLRTQFDATLRF